MKPYVIILDIVLAFSLFLFFFIIYRVNKKRKQERLSSGVHYSMEITPLQSWGSYFLIFCCLAGGLFVLHFYTDSDSVYTSLSLLLFAYVLLFLDIAADLLNRMYLSDTHMLRYQKFNKPTIIPIEDMEYATSYTAPNTFTRYLSYLEITLRYTGTIRVNKDNPSFMGLYYWLESHKVPLHKETSGQRAPHRRISRRDHF